MKACQNAAAAAAVVAAAVALALGAVTPLGSSVPGQPPALVLAPGPGPDPSPIPASLATVEFIISGYAPADSYGDKPVIGYGSGLFTGQAEPDQINGTITYKVPFSWEAHSYFVNVFLALTGHATCTIILVGPYPDRPVTLSSAVATGELATCSALATSGAIFSGWLSWLNQARPVPAGSRNTTTAGPGPPTGNGVAVLGQQGYPPAASAATRRHGTPDQIPPGS